MRKILLNEQKPDGYYVYVILNPTTSEFNKSGVVLPHTPIYLGKGKNKRIFDHVREAKSKKDNRKFNIHKISTIRRILSMGLEPIHMILVENISSDEALEYEGYLGDIIGYKFNNTGPLTNQVKTGIKNPILTGERNPFYGKQHSQETKNKIARKYKEWYSRLSEQEKISINEKRSLATKGQKPSQDQILKRLKAKYGQDFEIGKSKKTLAALARQQYRKNKRELREVAEQRRIEEITDKKNQGTYWSEIKGGANNPMFGQGFKLAGVKNGMAKSFAVHIAQYIFFVHGNIKQFQRAFMEKFNCQNPLRSAKMKEKYNIKMYETKSVPINAIIFKDALSLQYLGELTCKN